MVTLDPSLEAPLRSVIEYAKLRPERISCFGDKAYVHISSNVAPALVTRNRKTLEEAGVLKKRTKADLARSGIRIEAGYRGHYSLWEMDIEVAKKYELITG